MKRALLLCIAFAIVVAAVLFATCDGSRDAAVVAPVVTATATDEQKPTLRNRAGTPSEEPAPPPSESPAASGGKERTPGKPVTTVFPEETKIAQPQHTLHGRVIDASGKPVADATVTLVSCWLPDEIVFERVTIDVGQNDIFVEYPHVESVVRTDATGRFDLTYHEGGDRRLWVERGGRVRASVRDPTDAEFVEVTIADEAPSLTVRAVRAADAAPVAGARVRLRQRRFAPFEWLSFWTPSEDEPRAEATTDADGICRFDGCIAGSIGIEVLAQGLAPALGERVEIPASGTATREVRLVEGFTLTGRVVDAVTGGPVVGAEIHADPTRLIDATMAKTDGDGRFRIEHVPAAQARNFSAVEAHAAGFATETMTAGYVDEASRTCDLTFALHRPAGLRVRCVDPKGDPIADALVAAASSYMVTQKFGDVQAPRCSFSDDVSADSEADGRATIERLHPGGDGIELRVRFFLDGVPVLERSFPPLRSGETRDLGDVVLAQGLTLRGVVLDADGKPVAGATVVAAPHDAADETHAAIGDAVISHSGRRAETQPDGTFALMGLTKGLWDLYVSADIFSPGRLSLGVDPTSGGVSLRLPRVVALEGRVVDAKGSPVANANVVSAREEFGLRTIVSCGTGDDGRFSVPGFVADAGDVEVEVNLPGAAAQKFTARPGVPTTELRLRP